MNQKAIKFFYDFSLEKKLLQIWISFQSQYMKC